MRSITDVLKSIAVYVFILLFAAFYFFPLFWMWVIAFKWPTQDFTLGFIPWLQFQPTLINWVTEFSTQSLEDETALFNSTVISAGAALIATGLGVLAAYALARHEFKRGISNMGYLSYFLSLRFLPPIALAIPFYIFMLSIPIPGSKEGLLDSQVAVMLIDATALLPYAVLVLRDAFKSMPPAMEESAFVDGASTLKVLRSIALPLVAPALAAIFILTFAFAWNDFLFAYVLTAAHAYTMPIRLAATATSLGVLFYQLSIRQILAVIPPIILGLAVQKYIVSGLTLGAIKG
ncbi:MAG: carbohydrate ABC transporter permease [Nitrososphaeria archaeon]|jgi:multiple sugar transport system permease protein